MRHYIEKETNPKDLDYQRTVGGGQSIVTGTSYKLRTKLL